MPKALTIEEKQKRVEAAQVAKATGRSRTRHSAFNGTEGKLKVNQQIEGHHMYIFNDTPGRIDTALSSGYEFVHPDEVGGTSENVVSRNTDVGDKVRFLVGKAEDGGPLYAYLMKIKQEWWDEDQASLQERNNATDAAIKAGRTPGQTTEGFYMPKEGIKMT